MSDSGRKGWGTVLLAREPLTAEERRLRRRLIKLFLYAYAGLLFLLFLVFRHDELLVSVLWFLGLFGLVGWYWVVIQRSAKAGHINAPPVERRQAQRKMQRQLRTTPYWFFLMGAGFLIGCYGAHGSKVALYVASGLCFALGLASALWVTRFLRKSSGA